MFTGIVSTKGTLKEKIAVGGDSRFGIECGGLDMQASRGRRQHSGFRCVPDHARAG